MVEKTLPYDSSGHAGEPRHETMNQRENRDKETFVYEQPTLTRDTREKRQEGCCSGCRQTFFGLREFGSDSSNPQQLDLHATFAPRGVLIFIWKAIVAIFVIATFVYTLVDSQYRGFYFAYVTNWSLLVSCVYVILSLFNSCCVSHRQHPGERQRIGTITALTWISYVIASHAEPLVTIFFWSAEYTRELEVNFDSLAPHGLVAVLILVDGILINRIPVHWIHYWYLIVPYDLIYLLWTVLHFVFDVGNPNQSDQDPSSNDDAIYQVLQWEDDWEMALVLTVLVFVIGPIFFFLQRRLTMYRFLCGDNRLRLRYIQNNDNVEPDNTGDSDV